MFIINAIYQTVKVLFNSSRIHNIQSSLYYKFSYFFGSVVFPMCLNVSQVCRGGDFGARYYPPTKMPKRKRNAGCETYRPALLYLMLWCRAYFISLIKSVQFNIFVFFIFSIISKSVSPVTK